MAENGGPPRGRQFRALAVVLLALVAGVAIVVGISRWGNPPMPQPGENGNGANGNGTLADNGEEGTDPGIPPVEPPTPEECLQLIELRNRGLALLENGKWAEADAVLSQLAQRLPDDPVAVRNLAIARVKAYEDPTAGSKDDIAARTQTVLDQLQKIEPNSPATHRLAAQFALKRGESDFAKIDAYRTEAIRELQRAAELDPDDAANWLAIYQAAQHSSDSAILDKALPAFKRAFQEDPTNSYLALELALAEAAAKDANVSKTLAALAELLQPAMPTFTEAKPEYVADGLAKASEAAAAGQLEKVSGLLQGPANVVRPEDWVQSDLRRVHDIHPLRFIVFDFKTDVCRSTASTAADSVAPPPPIDVALRRFAQDMQPAGLEATRDVNLADFDLDRRPDVIALTDPGIEVLRTTAPGKGWATLARTPIDGSMTGLLVADLDRDAKPAAHAGTTILKPAGDSVSDDVATILPECQQADVDVVAFGPDGARVYRNELFSFPITSIYYHIVKTLRDEKGIAIPARELVVVEQSPEFNNLRDVLGGVVVDLDGDGDLDLIFSTADGMSLWSNRGDMTFYDLSDRSALPPADVRPTSLVAVDWDRDLDLDVVAVGPGGPIGWLENLRHGSTRWRSFEGKLAELAGGNSLGLLDVDANASWDLIGAGHDGLKLATTTTLPPGSVEPLTTSQIAETPASRVLVWDFDNDSFSDLLTWGDDGVAIWRAVPTGGFKPIDLAAADMPSHVTSAATADLDADGDLDLALTTPEGVVLFENQGGNQNHWLDIYARGEPDQKTGRVNHLGIGSLLELRAGPIYRPMVVNSQVTHFGLGKLEIVDSIRVLWTNGIPQVIVSPNADQEICETLEVKGSCPFVYTWTGHRFDFLTDASWAAPIGLQLAEGVYAQPRAWEYLKIPGERMVPRDGRYVIQMTEELWEATYFDQVELLAVDHPDNVEIYSNEKVGPAELAQFKVHTVRSPRLPVAARDMHGRDVLNTMAQQDGQFFKGFDRKYLQGLTEEHFLELDLGPLPGAKQITLFLTGWMRPTDTSLNVAISQNPNLAAPSPPALWVGDGAGGWRLARPFMGFPGGKTKTIAVDLSGLFTADDNRLRIVTNQEFFWDAACFTVDEEPVDMKLTHLTPVAADLHYRGFSALRPTGGYGPDTFEYNNVSTAPKWPPMSGMFTRYGDVTELLTAEDDLLAVVGAGDEITIEFALPADDPPPGWKRDFLLHNIGWDKDADLNTIYGQSVEPLPFGAMSGYPYRADESFPDTPRHRQYLRKYQTRQQNFQEFWGMLRGPN